MIRSAIARWRGSPAIGEGAVNTTSGVMSNALYSFGSSTGNEPCTSSSEMLAAAVASCGSLMVAQEMAKAHLKHEHVKTEAVLTLQEKNNHWDIAGIELTVSSRLPERESSRFQKAAKAATARCPISRSSQRADTNSRQAGPGRRRGSGLNSTFALKIGLRPTAWSVTELPFG